MPKPSENRVKIQFVNRFNPEKFSTFWRDGDEYLRVTGVAAVGDTVMNGQLYPSSIVEDMSSQAVGKIAPISHPPEVDGKMISAASAKALESGYAFTSIENSRYESGKMIVDLVTNISKSEGLRSVERYIAAVKNGERIGLSTGGGGLAVKEDGTQNGEQYNVRMVQASLDHVAILLDEQAAGQEFGTVIHNVKKGKEMPEETPKNEQSFDTKALINAVVSNALSRNLNVGSHMAAMTANSASPEGLAAAIVNALAGDEVRKAFETQFVNSLGFNIDDAKAMLDCKAEFEQFRNARKTERDALINAAIKNNKGKTVADFENWPDEAIKAIAVKNESGDGNQIAAPEGGSSSDVDLSEVL